MGGWCFCLLALITLVVVADIEQALARRVPGWHHKPRNLDCLYGFCQNRNNLTGACECPNQDCTIYGHRPFCSTDGINFR